MIVFVIDYYLSYYQLEIWHIYLSGPRVLLDVSKVHISNSINLSFPQFLLAVLLPCISPRHLPSSLSLNDLFIQNA